MTKRKWISVIVAAVMVFALGGIAGCSADDAAHALVATGPQNSSASAADKASQEAAKAAAEKAAAEAEAKAKAEAEAKAKA